MNTIAIDGPQKPINSIIDLFKFFASFLVVSIHAQPFYGGSADYYYNCFSVSAVPFFFCVSSYLFFLKESSSIKKYLKRILLLYLVWFIIELPLVFMRFSQYPTIEGSVMSFIKGFFLQNTFYASWFLMASCEALLLVYLLQKYTSVIFCSIVCVGFYIVGLFASMWGGVIQFLPNGELIVSVLKMICASQSFIVAIPYVFIGMIVARNKNILNKHNYALLLICVFLLGAYEAVIAKPYSMGKTVSLCMPWFIYILLRYLLSIHITLSKDVSLYIRKTSILIYLIHPVVILCLQHIFNMTLGWTLYIITLSTSIVLAFTIVGLSGRIRILRYLY